jgi:hypothetical protein
MRRGVAWHAVGQLPDDTIRIVLGLTTRREVRQEGRDRWGTPSGEEEDDEEEAPVAWLDW